MPLRVSEIQTPEPMVTCGCNAFTHDGLPRCGDLVNLKVRQAVSRSLRRASRFRLLRTISLRRCLWVNSSTLGT